MKFFCLLGNKVFLVVDIVIGFLLVIFVIFFLINFLSYGVSGE